MATLYQLTGNMLELYDMLSDPEIDEETLKTTMESVAYEIQTKGDGYAKIIKNLEADVEMLKGEIDKLTTRKQTLENNVKNMKKRLIECMTQLEINELPGELFTIKIRNNGKQLPENIEDYKEMIPAEYFIEQEPKLDKRKLLASVKSGKEGWIELRTPQSITIK